ncbi:MAG: PQQ-dependent sugar dehydrogenase [Jatrophihabitantaceae bacterium]
MRASLGLRARAGAVLAAGALLLAACASPGGSNPPDWKPKPSFSGEGYGPPANQQPVQPRTPTQRPGTSNPRTRSGDPAVVAKRLTAPTGIAILPDNTALVGERTTGRIVRVQPQPGKPVPTVRTIPGIATSGDGGLLDLAISPHYPQDKLIFAYITTPKDNRVVAFTLTGPITPVLIGIPRGTTGNTGRLAFAADGNLLVGTGDAGRPALAKDPRSVAGKILRVSDIGAAAPDNPARGSRVYAAGFERTDGLCAATDALLYFQTEYRPQTAADPVFHVVAGATYGSAPTARQPVEVMPATSRAPGGCAVLKNVLFTTTLDGKALLSAPIRERSGSVTLGAFSPTLRNRYGRLHTVVAAPDGALWISTSNKDGKGKPVAADERVLRIVPSGGGGGNNPL